MDVLPVIDVANGKAVRAIRGARANYQPLVTPLAASHDPAIVARGFRTLYPFRKFYIADLDGIEGRGRNVHLVPSLSRELGGAEIWIDAGTESRGAARVLLAAPIATLVVGSESLETIGAANDILSEAPHRTVLSLDFRGDEFMGPRQLLADPTLWPDRVIVMTLVRVGSDEGPDFARLRDIVGRGLGRKVYAAGGIRHKTDLLDAAAVGVHGALIASALHGQKISAGDLKEITGR